MKPVVQQGIQLVSETVANVLAKLDTTDNRLIIKTNILGVFFSFVLALPPNKLRRQSVALQISSLDGSYMAPCMVDWLWVISFSLSNMSTSVYGRA